MFGMRDLEEERERRDNMASSEVSMKGNCVNGKGETNDGVGDGQNGSSSSSSGGNSHNNTFTTTTFFCFSEVVMFLFLLLIFQKLKFNFTESYGMLVRDRW